MCKNKVLVPRNGKWYDQATGEQFVGKTYEKGLWYEYTKEGRKIPLKKPSPDANRVINNLWEFENPQRLGYKNGLFRPFVTPNGNTDFGPGIDLRQQTAAFRRRAQQGFTQQQMDQEVRKRVDRQLIKVDGELGKYTHATDTVSPQIKEGLADLRWQTGSLTGFPKLLKSVATGNLRGIQEETKTYYKNNQTGKMTLDKRRHDARLKNYFHYKNGGTLLGLPWLLGLGSLPIIELWR